MIKGKGKQFLPLGPSNETKPTCKGYDIVVKIDITSQYIRLGILQRFKKLLTTSYLNYMQLGFSVRGGD